MLEGSAGGNGEVSLEAAGKLNKNNNVDLTVVLPKSSDFSGPSSSLVPTAARDHQAPDTWKTKLTISRTLPVESTQAWIWGSRGSKYIFCNM